MARFEDVVNLQPQQTSTGAAGGFMSLASRLERFADEQSQLTGAMTSVMQKQAVERGRESARQVDLETDERGITKKPPLKKKRFIGSIEVEAHNKALRAAYVASLSNDIREGIGKIRADNPDDLAKFNEISGSYAKGILETVEPSVRDLVIADLDQNITSNRMAVQAAEIKKENDIAFQTLQESAKNLNDDIVLQARSGNIQGSADGLVKLSGILESQVDAGFITAPQAREQFRTAELNATISSTIGKLRTYLDKNDFNGALQSASNIDKIIPRGMSVPEHSELMNSMISEINQAIALNTRMEAAGAKALKSQQNTNFDNLYIGVVEGTTGVDDILRQLRLSNINQRHADTLIDIINNRGAGVNDWDLINEIENDIRNEIPPGMIKHNILSNAGKRLTDKQAATLINRLNQSLDKESPLHDNRVKRARTYIVNSIRVTGMFGSLDSEKEKKLAENIRQFDERVLSGEDPFFVADELVGKDSFERAPTPYIGKTALDKNNLDKAQEKLDKAFIGKQIDKTSYNYNTELIIQLKKIQQNIDAFEKAKREMKEVQ